MKGVSITDKEVIKDYFKANLNALKYYNIPPIFLDLLKRLFNGVLVMDNYIRLINKVIRNYIDPELLTADVL
jgi:hypothetical protein